MNLETAADKPSAILISFSEALLFEFLATSIVRTWTKVFHDLIMNN